MFRRENRLLKSEDFSFVFQRPVKCRGDCFELYARKNGGVVARLGLAISKKSLKKAVDRNHVKRLFRESFRSHTQSLQGFDLVVVMKKPQVKWSRSGKLPLVDKQLLQLIHLINRHD